MSAVSSTVPWLDEIRSVARAAFAEADAPSDDEEVWRYSRIGDVDLTRYSTGEDSADAPDPVAIDGAAACLLYTSPSPRDQRGSRMPSSA